MAVQQVAQQQDALGIGQGRGPGNGEIRMGDGKLIPQQRHRQEPALPIPGKGAPGGHLLRVARPELLQIEFQGFPLFIVDDFHNGLPISPTMPTAWG